MLSMYLHPIAVDIVQGRRCEKRGVVVVIHLYRPRVRHRTVTFQQLHVSQSGENNLFDECRVRCISFLVRTRLSEIIPKLMILRIRYSIVEPRPCSTSQCNRPTVLVPYQRLRLRWSLEGSATCTLPFRQQFDTAVNACSPACGHRQKTAG